MLETLIVILLVIWLVSFGLGGRGGRRMSSRWRGGNLVHLLLVIILILLLVRFLQ